ncbi:MAG: CT583 family protein, partial [Chlamydiia bacterium]|nr:CT583 family protein [Chlamydiia bacterium]
SKMSSLATQSANGNLSTFAGVFGLTPLSAGEEQELENLLRTYAHEGQDFRKDLKDLSSLTSEVKAINNQAALLHGERIKKAHDILIEYRDGAFTSWLMNTYGNRQTPYNLMQYFELYRDLPTPLRQQVEAMPKQAVYTLASRAGPFDQKKQIIENYQGENKAQLLGIIRETFPLNEHDKRRANPGDQLIENLQKISESLDRPNLRLTAGQKRKFLRILDELLHQAEEF